MCKFLRAAVLLTATVFLSFNIGKANVAVSVTYTGTAPGGTLVSGSPFSSLGAAITALNAATFTGTTGVTLTCAASGTETAPVIGGTGGYQITASGSGTCPIVINGNGSTITAATGLTSGTLTDGIFKLVGAGYITLENFTMVENSANTTTAAGSNNMTEWGVALLYSSTTKGSSNNNITGNTISLNSAYSNTFGVYSNTNHSATNVTTLAPISSAAGENGNNTIANNTISSVNVPICFSGNSTYFDAGNTIGASTLGNTINNWGGNTAPASAFYNAPGFIGYTNCYGIYMLNQANFNVNYNTLTNGTTGTSINAALYGIYHSNLGSSGATTNNITYNTIGSSSANSGLISATTNNTYPVVGIYTNATTSGLTLNINYNTIQGCAITGASASYFYGIENAGSVITNLYIQNNTISGNSTASTTGGFYGIWNNANPVSGNIYLNNNTIGVTYSAVNSSTSYAIYNAAGASTATLQIDNNVFQNFNFTNASASSTTVYFISNAAQTKNQDISSNNYNNIQMNSSGSNYFINTSSLGAAGTKSINSNYITTAYSTNSNSSVYFLQDAGSSTAGSTLQYNSNNFSNVTIGGSGSINGFIANDGSSSNKSVTGNTFNNISGAAAVTILSVASGATNTISNNTISNINAGSTMQGMAFSSSSGTCNISSNTISNLYSTSSGSSGFGINISGGGAYNIFGNTINQVIVFSGQPAGIYTLATGAENIYQNNISHISTAGSGYTGFGIAVQNGTSAVNVYQDTISNSSVGAYYYDGIYLSLASGASNRIYKNVIYNLSSTTGNTGTNVVGIYISGGSATTADTVYQNKIYGLSGALSGVFAIQDASPSTVFLFNNLISQLSSNNAVANIGIAGIYEGGSGTVNKYIYYNTVYLSGSMTGAESSTDIYETGSTGSGTCNLTLADNILVNDMTYVSGLALCIYRSATSFANYNAASNNNLLWPGGTTGNHYVCDANGTGYQTLANYITGAGGSKDAASVSQDEAANFMNTNGNYPDFLYLNPGSSNGCYNAGVTVASITLNTDYLSNNRFGNAAYTGAATKPTIGAYEIIKATNDAGVSAFTIPSPLCAGSQTVKVSVTNYGTSALGSVTVNWTVNGVAQTPQTFTSMGLATGATSAALTLGTYTFGSGSYIITANTSSPNSLTDGNSSNDSYTQTYASGLNGIYTVGATGADFTTLSSAVAAYNAAAICGPVVFSLQSNYSSAAESFPLHILANTGASAINTLTIKPASGTSPVISGSSGTGIFLLDGAGYIKIDGSNSTNGTTRDLTIINTNLMAGDILFVDGTIGSVVKNSVVLSNAQSSASYQGVVNISLPTTTTANSTDTVQNNEITSDGFYTAYGVYNSGTSGKPASNCAIIGNVIHDLGVAGIYDAQYSSNLMISGNTIFNYSEAATTYGIYSSSTGNKHIVNNNIYQSTSVSFATQYGIDIATAASSGTGDSVYYNYIGGTQANAGGSSPWTNSYSGATFYGIYYTQSGSTAVANIFGNTVSNITLSSAGSNILYGIEVANGYANIGLAGTGNGNTVSTLTTGTSASTGGNNLVGLVTISSGIVNMSYDTVSNLTAYGSGNTFLTGAYFGATGAGASVTNNVISNLISSSTASNDMSSTANNAGNAAIAGIDDGSTGTGLTIANNTISTLVCTSNSSSAYPYIVGIGTDAANTAVGYIYGNKIYDLENNATDVSTLPGIDGIRISKGFWEVYNNQVILNNTTLAGTVLTNNIRIYGIDELSGAASGKPNVYYFNSVFIGGSTTSAAGISSAWELSKTSTVITVEDNLLYNVRTSAGGGNYAMTLLKGGTAPATFVSNNNDLYSVGNSFNFLGQKGSIAATTAIATWRTTAPTGDAASLVQQAYFNQSNPPTTDLTLSNTSNCLLTGKGLAINTGTFPPSTAGTGITKDYNIATRPGPPNIGAIEFTSSNPTVSAGSPQSACTGTTVTMAGTNPASIDAIATGAWTPTTGLATPTAYNSGYTGFVTGANATQTWTITDGSCTGSGTVIITGVATPQGSLTGNTVCSPGAGMLTWSATAGTGPYTIVYNNGASNITATGVVSGTAFATSPTNPTSNLTCTLVSVTDNGNAQACARTTGFTGGTGTVSITNCTSNLTLAAGQSFTGATYTPGLTSAINGTNANLLGFSLSSTAACSVSQLALNLSGATIGDYGNFRIIRDVDLDGAWDNSDVTVGTVSTYGSTITFSGLSENISSTPTNYLLVADVLCTSTTGNAVTASIQSSGISTTATAGGTTQTGGAMAVGNFPANPGNPTSNSPQCPGTGVTITESGSPSGTDAWYWVSSATGTSTTSATTPENETTAGTYYIRAQSTYGCWSTGAGSVTISTLPVPQGSFTGNSVCAGGNGMLTFTATAGTGPYNLIYNTSVTANNENSGTAFASVPATISSTTPFTLVSVTDNNGCVRNSGFTAGTATITVTPGPTGVTASASPTSVCSSGPVNLTATPTNTTSAATYTFAATTGTLDNMSTGTTSMVAAANDDGVSSAVTLPFTFSFAGSPQTSFWTNSNGLMGFGTTTSAEYDNTSFTSFTTAANYPGAYPIIAPWWDDLSTASNGSVKYALFGTAPNRHLTVEFDCYKTNSTSSSYDLTFQVQIYETTNVIEMVYGSGAATASATVGIAGSATDFQSVTTTSGSGTVSALTANTSNTTWPYSSGSNTAYVFTPVTGYTYAWSPTTNMTGSTTATPTVSSVSSNTTYNVTVSNSAGCGTSNSTAVTVISPAVTGTTPGSVCGTGTVTLAATGSAGTVLNWYAASTGGTSLGTGTSFTTPSISTTTPYYVEADAQTNGNVGPADNTIGTTGNSTASTGAHVLFTVTSATVLNSVTVYPASSGVTAHLYIYNSAATLLSTITYTTGAAGVAQVVPVNYTFAAATNYYLQNDGTNLGRNTTGVTYPYTSGPISITGTTGTATAYYFFYNWNYSVVSCASARTQVNATVQPAATFSPAAPNVCAGTSSTVITVTNPGTSGSFGTITGAGSAGCSISGSGTSYAITAGATPGTATTTYTATGVCPSTLSFTVVANPTNTTSTTSICTNQTKTVVTSGTGGSWSVTGGGSISGTTYTPVTAGGTIGVYYTDVNSCVSPTQSFTAVTQPTFTPASPSVCLSGSTAITVNNPGSGSFGAVSGVAGSSITGSGSSYTFTAGSGSGTATTTYTYSVCTNTLSVTVNNTPPVATSGTASSITNSSATVAGLYVSNCQTVTAYGIEYSTTNNFTNGSGTPVASTNQVGGSYTSALSGLAANTTYYFHAYASYSGPLVYGAQGSFKTAPACPAITAPTNNATGVTSGVLSWSASAGATSYDVYFGTTLPGSATTNVTTTTYTATGLLPGTTYVWQIIAKSASGASAGCSTYTFTTGALPSCATYSAPANASTGQLSPVLTWGSVSGATGYNVYFGTSNPPTTVVSSNQAGTTYTPTVASNTAYYWYVVPQNALGAATGCNGTLWSFTSASTLNIPASGNNSVACGTNTVLYLNNGTANYSNSDNGYAVLNATPGSSEVINVSGNYVTESGSDFIKIYDGVGTSGTLLGSYSGSGSINITGTAGHSVTVKFTSNGSANYSGTALNVTYTGSCALSPDDAGVTAVTTPSPICALTTEACTATVSNYGSNTLTSVTLNWSLNGGTITSQTFTGLSVANGATTNLSFNVTFPAGVTANSLAVSTSLPNGVADGNAANDSHTASGVYTALSGTYTVGTSGNFTTLTAAAAYANTYGLCASTIFSLTNTSVTGYDDINEGGLETYPITFNALAGAGPTVTLTIQPATTATLTESDYSGGIFDFESASYIILNGGSGSNRNLTIQSGSDGDNTIYYNNTCVGDVINNCNILAYNADAFDESPDIYFTGSGAAQATITNCSIHDFNYTTGGFAFDGIYSDNNSALLTITNNNIYNCLSTGVTLAGCADGCIITGNSIYFQPVFSFGGQNWNTDFYLGEGLQQVAIAVVYGSGHTISGNFIGGQSANGGTASTPWTISTYDPVNYDYAENEAGVEYATSFYGIYLGTNESSPTVSTVSNNVIQNISLTDATGGNSLSAYGMGITCPATVSGNTIGNSNSNLGITVGGAGSTDLSQFIGIGAVLTGSATISNNVVANVTGNGSAPRGTDGNGYVYVPGAIGISYVNGNGGSISNNQIYNLSSTAKTAMTVSTTPASVAANKVTTAADNSDYYAAVIGIVVSNFNSASTTGMAVNGNTVYNLHGTTTTTAITGVVGIGLDASSGNAYDNKIYGLTNTSTATSTYPGIVGTRVWGGTGWNVYNNQIILSNTNNATVFGMSDVTSQTEKYYFNSVYLGGSATGPSSAAFNQQFANNTVTLQNNILYNTRSASGGNYAIDLNLATAPTTFASNYNELYVSGTPAYIGLKGAGTNETTFSNWQGAYSGDANSVNKVVYFNQSTPPTTDLTPSSTSNCALYRVGTPITTGTYPPSAANSGITLDYTAATTRNNPPDIGAVEFASTFPVISAGTNQTVCYNTSAALAGTQPPADGIAVGAWAPGAGITYSPNAATYNASITAGLAVGPNTETWTVTDGSCTGNASVTITVNPQFFAPVIAGTNVLCNGQANGTISITTPATGGTGPYTYSLNGGAYQSGIAFTNVAPGTYSVVAKDFTGCFTVASNSVTISQPSVLSAVSITETDALCYGANNGTVTVAVTPTGGTAPYQYSLNNGTYQGGTTFTGLVAGGYTVVAKDANGCISSSSNAVTIGQPAVTSATAGNTGPYVAGQTISLSSSSAGATSYLWSGPNGYSTGGQTPSITGSTTAMAGVYTVTATNATACTATASTTVVVTTNATYTWTGATGTSDWTNPSNWVPTSPVGGPNSCAIDVIIPSVLHNPVISVGTAVGNLQMNSGSQLVLNGANISVCKNLTGGSGGHAAVIGSGTVVLTGSTLQTFTGYFSMQELMLSNSTGASMLSNSAVDLYTSLDLQTGNFDATNGTLTFKSNTVDSVAILDNFSTGYAGTLTGNVTAERYYMSSLTEHQHYMGSPINSPSLVSQFGASGTQGQVLDTYCDETQTNYNSPYGTVFAMNQGSGYNCGIEQWSVITAGNAQNGVGYSLLKPGTGKLVLNGQANLDTRYQVSGLQNSGWSNTTMQSRPQTSGWQLLSNPYLATLDISTVPGGFDNQVQIWNAEGPYQNSYQPGLIGTDAVVAPFQGFMVHKTAVGGSATFTINATDRVRTPATFYHQNASELKIIAANNATGLLDQTTVAFNSAATDTFDAQYDAQKMGGSLGRHTLYTINNNKWMAINAFNSVATTSSVPMGFEPGKTGNFTFSFNGVNTFDPTSYIYLEDKSTAQWYNVRSGSYSFNADSADGWNRFVLHFTPPTQINTIDGTCNTSGTINIQQPGNAYWNYTLTDSNNVLVSTGTLNQVQPLTMQIAPGRYVLTLTDTNNYVAVKTIQVNGPTAVSAAFMVSADTVIPEQTVVVVANTPDAASYLWSFGNGTIAIGADAMVNYTQPGVYMLSLLVTNQAGCSSTQTHTVTVTNASSTGLTNLNGVGNVKIWSNENKIYVDFNNLHLVGATVIIYDILGQQISNENVTAANLVYQKEIRNIEASYFIVMVKNDDKLTAKKVFIINSK